MKFADYQLEWFIYNLMAYLHAPYKWGGDDPTGIDCSGLVVDSLHACGMLKPKTDYTANGLWELYKGNRINGEAQEGDLLFWFVGDRATHVAVALDPHFCITADGGGSTTLDLDDAVKQNAFVKIRPIQHRNTEPKIVRIF